MTIKFIRRNWTKFSRLGKKRKKKQVWRRAKGRHSKTREKRKGYPIKVMIGFKQPQKPKPIFVNNAKELEKVKKGETIIVGKLGMKKKIEIARIAKEKKILVCNININKLLKKAEKAAKKEETKSKEAKK